MNCKGCGAPLSGIDQAGRFQCQFCGTVEANASKATQTVDGVEITKTRLDESVCPRCHTSLHYAKINRTEVAACDDCNGMYLRRSDFGGIVHARRQAFEGTTEQISPLNPDELRVAAECPCCHTRMDTYPYAGPGAVVIDYCGRCDCVWVDAGELTRIEQAPGPRAR